MSRLQLALNVPNLDDAIAFYTKFFGTEPAKVRPGYANFAIANPPLKLVLFEGGEGNTINHLGVEVESTDLVVAATERFQQLGMPTDIEEHTTCCFAVQDKVWVSGPDATRWEVYTVLDDAATMYDEGADCCAPTQAPAAASTDCCAPATAAPVQLGAKPTVTQGSCC